MMRFISNQLHYKSKKKTKKMNSSNKQNKSGSIDTTKTDGKIKSSAKKLKSITKVSILLMGLFLIGTYKGAAQSFEVMAGHERIFIDAQYLKYFDDNYKWSLFSRARATTTYGENPSTDLFSAGYLNYTIKNGFGVSAVGRISTFGSGIDLGPHVLKRIKSWTLFILPTININNELLYSWFSILKFEPTLSEKFKLYTSYEQFSAFNSNGHSISVQRIRIGINKSNFILGVAANLRESGTDLSNFNSNIGAFIKKEF